MTTTHKNAQAAPKTFDKVVTPAIVAAQFGISEAELKTLMGKRAWPVLNYRVIEGDERDAIILGILERIDQPDLRVVGGNDNAVWERGWGEILEKVRKSGFSPEILHPQYLFHHNIMRFCGQYIDAGNTQFICDYDHLLRYLTLARHMKGSKKVVELGCGTGTSQLMLAEMLPADVELVASDWAKPSQEIIRSIAAYAKREIKPVCFNMLTLEGWDELTVDKNTTVLTVHALEQLGGNHSALLDKLLAAKPERCVHMEPISEVYDKTTLFDALAIRYHKRRNYLDGYLTRLRELAAQKKVEIISEYRLAFGDRYHEAFSIVEWKPL